MEQVLCCVLFMDGFRFFLPLWPQNGNHCRRDNPETTEAQLYHLLRNLPCLFARPWQAVPSKRAAPCKLLSAHAACGLSTLHKKSLWRNYFSRTKKHSKPVWLAVLLLLHGYPMNITSSRILPWVPGAYRTWVRCSTYKSGKESYRCTSCGAW